MINQQELEDFLPYNVISSNGFLHCSSCSSLSIVSGNLIPMFLLFNVYYCNLAYFWLPTVAAEHVNAIANVMMFARNTHKKKSVTQDFTFFILQLLGKKFIPGQPVHTVKVKWTWAILLLVPYCHSFHRWCCAWYNIISNWFKNSVLNITVTLRRWENIHN